MRLEWLPYTIFAQRLPLTLAALAVFLVPGPRCMAQTPQAPAAAPDPATTELAALPKAHLTPDSLQSLANSCSGRHSTFSRRDLQSATVDLKLMIDGRGHVTAVELARSSGNREADLMALTCYRKARLTATPDLVEGHPTAGWQLSTYRLQIAD